MLYPRDVKSKSQGKQDTKAESAVDDGWCLEGQSPKAEVEASPMALVPRLCTPIDERPDEFPLATEELPGPFRGTPVPAEAEADKPLVPTYGRMAAPLATAELPQPMAELAQGSFAPEEPVEPPKNLAEVARAGGAESAFDATERAFFAQGEELANQEQKLDDFLDLADRTLSFWQRLWRR